MQLPRPGGSRRRGCRSRRSGLVSANLEVLGGKLMSSLQPGKNGAEIRCSKVQFIQARSGGYRPRPCTSAEPRTGVMLRHHVVGVVDDVFTAVAQRAVDAQCRQLQEVDHAPARS